MICAQVVDQGASAPQVFSPAASQPIDPSVCDAVILTGTDTQYLSFFQMPAAADLATAFVVGFTLVVGSYVFAWGAGAVVNMFRN